MTLNQFNIQSIKIFGFFEVCRRHNKFDIQIFFHQNLFVSNGPFYEESKLGNLLLYKKQSFFRFIKKQLNLKSVTFQKFSITPKF